MILALIMGGTNDIGSYLPYSFFPLNQMKKTNVLFSEMPFHYDLIFMRTFL